MNIFSAIKLYPGSWAVKNTRNFSAEELEQIVSAVVVDSQYGNSVCLTLKSGGKGFIPLSNTSSAQVGDAIDMTSAKLMTLGREGDADIYRIDA